MNPLRKELTTFFSIFLYSKSLVHLFCIHMYHVFDNVGMNELKHVGTIHRRSSVNEFYERM